MGQSQVHYPCFDSKLLVSAGNDQRLLVWDQRQFEHRPEPSSRFKGGGGGGGVGSDGEKLKQPGKKKGKTKGLNKNKSASATAVQPSSNDGAFSTSGVTGRGSSDGAGGVQAPAPREDGGVVRCSSPLLSVRLEDKPNWVTSLGTPYPAIAIADTSSVAKVLRRHGGV